LYHHRVDHPQHNDRAWFCHTHLKKAGETAANSTSVMCYCASNAHAHNAGRFV